MTMKVLRKASAWAIVAFAAIFAVFGTNFAEAQTREGAPFISGQWHVTGGYSAGDTTVDFTVQFSADGTFVDRDNYRGRWVISGTSFSMYYPDESQLGYAGVISGDTITGRFEGESVAGNFTMRPISRQQASSAPAGNVAGSWTIDFDAPGGHVPWVVSSDGTFRQGEGAYSGTWSQNGSTIVFYVPSSGITHTGALQGDRIQGAYQGPSAQGTFTMWRDRK